MIGEYTIPSLFSPGFPTILPTARHLQTACASNAWPKLGVPSLVCQIQTATIASSTVSLKEKSSVQASTGV